MKLRTIVAATMLAASMNADAGQTIKVQDWIYSVAIDKNGIYKSGTDALNYEDIIIKYECLEGGKFPFLWLIIVSEVGVGFYVDRSKRVIRYQLDDNEVETMSINKFDDNYFALNPKNIKVFSQQLRKGTTLKVELKHSGGDTIYPVFSLKGATTALNYVDTKCGPWKKRIQDGLIINNDKGFK